MSERALALAAVVLGWAGCAPAPGEPAALAVPVAPAAPELQRFRFEEVHFGNVPVELCLCARDQETARAAARVAFARVAELT
ncbi:MAG: hypothetical protein FJ265_21940, partial [Planctomycetes bacterium]|nr:hypothetical protein [Planctomycetota bacterium]